MEMKEKKINAEGLKFHITLPEDDSKVFPEKSKESRKLYKQAWDIIQTTLREQQVEHFKIASDTVRMSEEPSDGSQRGKDITIYAHHQIGHIISLQKWCSILEEITDKLENAGIPPGIIPASLEESSRGVKHLTENDYLSYRHDPTTRGRPDTEAMSNTWLKYKNIEIPEQIDHEILNVNNNNPNGNNDDSCCKCSIT